MLGKRIWSGELRRMYRVYNALRRGVVTYWRGGYWEPVIVQQRHSRAVIIANSTVRASTCTIAAMQGAEPWTSYMVMDDARTLSSRLGAVNTNNADPKRWCMVADVDGPRAARMIPTPRAQRGGLQEERRWFKCCPVGAVNTITSNGKCEVEHGNVNRSVGHPS